MTASTRLPSPTPQRVSQPPLLLPLVSGISYEILRFIGRHDDSKFWHGFAKPGLWLQKFTTDEPDASIIEVAIASIQAVIPENSEDDRW